MVSSTVLNIVIDERDNVPTVEVNEDLRWAALRHVRTSNSSRVIKNYVLSSESVVV